MQLYNIKKVHAMAILSGNISLSDVGEGIRDDVKFIYDQLVKEKEVNEDAESNTSE